MSDLLDPENYRDQLGTTETVDLGPISRKEVRRYARAVEDDNPLFWDLEYARAHGYDDLVVPPNMLPALIEVDAGVPADQLREDGLPPALGVTPEFPDEVRMMNGERRFTFHRYATAGETITRESTFDDIYQKDGSSAGPLTFTVTIEKYLDEGGERILTNEETHIYRIP